MERLIGHFLQKAPLMSIRNSSIAINGLFHRLKAYRISGNEKYIQSWIEVYNNWINQNPKPESGTNTTSWWQLQVATRINDQVQLLEYFKNSINFTPEWLTTF